MHPLKDPRFQCISPLGQGSYGKVYQAYDTLLNRVIAIKCLTDPQSEEMAALCLLAGEKHAGLVEIYDVLLMMIRFVSLWIMYRAPIWRCIVPVRDA